MNIIVRIAIASIVFCIVTRIVAYFLVLDVRIAPAPFFRVDDAAAYYSIRQTGSQYWVTYSERPAEYERDEWRYGRISVLVGRSDVPLASYVGKRVYIDGQFRPSYASEQCVLDTCVPIGHAVVIDINDVEEL